MTVLSKWLRPSRVSISGTTVARNAATARTMSQTITIKLPSAETLGLVEDGDGIYFFIPFPLPVLFLSMFFLYSIL
jgi:hypothetical protein